MKNIQNNPWFHSCESYRITEKDSKKYLTAYLYDKKQNIIENKIRLHPLLENYPLHNKNGILTYNLTKEEDDYVMTKLFPTYEGETIEKIEIKECVMLSVDIDKYNTLRDETMTILNQYTFPNIKTFFGFTSQNVADSKYYKCMMNKTIRNELTCGRLEIFERFVQESNGNEWLLHFEDDVRPVNLDKNEILNFLYNVPKDAELIRPYIGSNSKCKLQDVKYKESYGGGLNHAFYISTNGCKKVINYAKKYGWKFRSDADLYKISKFYQEIPCGFDGWSLKSTNGKCDAVKLDLENEKLCMYHMDIIIFNQTSLPCAPFSSCNLMK